MREMKTTAKKWVLVAASAALGVATAAPFEKTIDGLGVGPVTVTCADPGGWTLSATPGVGADGVPELALALDAPSPRPLPKVAVTFDFPAIDAHHKWTGNQNPAMPPNWSCGSSSRLCSGFPIVAFLNDGDRNRATVACSEAKRQVNFDAGYREEDSHLVWKVRLFEEIEAPAASYRAKFRFDRRDVFFGDAISDASAWITETSKLTPAKVPPAAFEPLYSAWYSFHQNVSDKEVEAECAEAAKLGMKVLIVDDGWQTDDNNRGYAYCGDWQVSTNRFPDFAAHVARVHALGMKYMIWFGVPIVGPKSANYPRFKDKFLYGTTLDEYYDNVDKDAKDYVKDEMVKYAIARAENLTVTDEEYTAGAEDYAKNQYGLSSAAELESMYDKKTIRQALLYDKVHRAVVDYANVTLEDFSDVIG